MTDPDPSARCARCEAKDAAYAKIRKAAVAFALKSGATNQAALFDAIDEAVPAFVPPPRSEPIRDA